MPERLPGESIEGLIRRACDEDRARRSTRECASARVFQTRLPPDRGYNCYGWAGERPVNCAAFIRAVVAATDSHGGESPLIWRLPRDGAIELAADLVGMFRGVGGFRDKDGKSCRPPTTFELMELMETGEPPQVAGVKVMIMTTQDLLREVTQAGLPISYVPDADLRAAQQQLGVAPLTELRPPPEHEGKPLHWVDWPNGTFGHTGCETVLRWQAGVWYLTAHPAAWTPAQAADAGWRYLGPAEPPPGTLLTPLRKFARETWHEECLALRSKLAELLGRDTDALRVAGDTLDEYAARIAELEAENARLTGMLAGKLSISIADVMFIHKSSGASFNQPRATTDQPIDPKYVTRIKLPSMERGFGEQPAPSVVALAPEPATAKPLPAHALRGGDGIVR